MKPLLVIFCFTLGFSHFSYGQVFELSGEVKDQYQEPVAFASVFLLTVTDSTLVTGTSADENGAFLFSNIAEGLYFLKASYIGQVSENLPLEILKDTKIGALILEQEAEQLNEVTVTSNKPVVKREVDRIVFNVENTVISQNSSWDILRQTPGVIMMNDELKVRNQATTVYINDRKVQLSSDEVKSLLENYQGENIKSVEVIHNPPASYDAEGGSILNIITSKNVSIGYKGNVNAGYTQGVFPKYNFGTSHFYKTKRLNVNASYNYAPKKEYKNTLNNTNFMGDSGIVSVWDTDFDQVIRSNTHSAGLVIDYDFNDKNVLSFTSNALIQPKRDADFFQETTIKDASGVLDSLFTTNSFLSERKNNISGDLTFKHQFKDQGNLTVNAHYTNFDLDRNQDVNSDYFEPNGSFIRDFNFSTLANQQIEIKTAQIDYNDYLGSVFFETGIKSSFIDSESKLDYFLENNGTEFIPNLSDDYTYDESVYAGYFSLSKDWEKWSVKTGLRAEQTESSGVSVNVSTINDLSYFELFPSFYLLHNINDNHSLSFDYARKVQRPRYEDLNPFRTYINERTFEEGNPNLMPSFGHNFNLNYTLNQEYYFDFYYRDNGRYISTLTFQDNDNFVLRDITQNVLESTSYGIDFTYGKSITNNWYLYSYISLFHEDETFIALQSDDYSFKNVYNGAYIDLTNYVTLSNDGSFKGELGFVYLSGWLQGSYIQEESTNLTVGLRKSFFNNRAVLSVSANDLLGNYNSYVSSQYLNQDNRFLTVPETQYVKFGFTYNFGNFRLEDNQRSIDKLELDRLE
ncbi:CarboxypepD_reg-like domain-containing protein [Maribacter dokdonensis]|uniref:CarboxypepD_reg-like domain-containing protein n=1 Tax=Maribacter dokdonensis TaxID=320912 RepID=A0A1H4KYL4_9FLAO|nr:outer membrane beta-barrel family protein [Maribacter dokdonensis]SEB63208.1 CarboxypepD_reg-like domain-containing protein [Maribacter dokdonensis]